MLLLWRRLWCCDWMMQPEVLPRQVQTCVPDHVARSAYAEYVERVRGYHATATYRKVMHKRKVWPEPLFGEAKQWHVLRQFRLRGLANVNMEGLLIAAGQNLKRWLAATGWGRRPGPNGGPAAVAPANQPGL